MISDEMRELLSAYADGELEGAEMARAEALLAGDTRLKRELDAYRRVGASLRAWDRVEHGGEPSPRMAERVLARIRASAGGGVRGGPGAVRPLLALLTHPLAMAAGLLAAFGLGLHFAEPPAEVRAAAPETLARAEPEPFPPLRIAPLPETVEIVAHAPESGAGFDVAGAIRRESGLCERAETLRAEWAADQRRWTETGARRAATESRTGTENPRVAALLASCEFAPTTLEALLCVRGMGADGAPAAAALAAGRKVALDSAVDAGRVRLKVETPSLALFGEVFVAEGGAAGRARLLGASHWIEREEFAPVSWADEIAPPADNRAMLQALPWMLGPRARHRLLAAGDGRDPAFLLWLREECKGKALVDHLGEKAAARERVVTRLVEALRADAEATGFAVFAGDALQGVEIFASHSLMMQFASRLLHGYLLEAGGRPLHLTPPGAGAAALLAQAEKLIAQLPQNAARYEDEDDQRGTREGWPEGLTRVVLKDGVGTILGAGLLTADRPLHVTLFR